VEREVGVDVVGGGQVRRMVEVDCYEVEGHAHSRTVVVEEAASAHQNCIGLQRRASVGSSTFRSRHNVKTTRPDIAPVYNSRKARKHL
jgi:hypothetical protein